MSGLFSGIGSAVGSLFGGGGTSSPAVNAAAITPGLLNLGNISGTLENLGNQEIGYGNTVTPTAINQFQAGATGQLTPAMAALAATNLSSSDTATKGAYSNLGLGGSTMESQDLATNQLRNTAETANLEAQEEQLGLEGAGVGLNFLNAGGGQYMNAGSLTQSQIQDILAALNPGGSTGSTSSPGALPTGTGVGGLGSAGTDIFGAGTTTSGLTAGDLSLSGGADAAVTGLDSSLGGLTDADLLAAGLF